MKTFAEEGAMDTKILNGSLTEHARKQYID